MVDADPQCNLTEIALARTIEALDTKATRSRKSKIPDLPGTSILDVLNQRIKGDVPFIELKSVELVEPESRLFLLRGSVDISSIEDDLAEAHVQRLAMRTNLMRTYVSIGDFLTRLAKEQAFDYIFIDVGPSSGALTRAFFLTCDAFFLPVAPDRFNVQAIITLSKIIDRWMGDHALIHDKYQQLGLPIRPGSPAFLGAIVQAFKVYAKRPKPGYKLWMDRLPKQITESIKPVIQKAGTTKSYLPSGKSPIAVKISDFNQLAPLMQEVGKAVFNITQDDTARISESGKPWAGNNWKQAQVRMDDYRHLLEELALILDKFQPELQ
jgi:hypothetical protein